MYLRKSRMDTDFDDVSVEETLNRHRRILESFCKERRLNVVETLEEVVSGESLSARPQMLRLLDLVNTGMYAGVVCVDIERLSRGSSLESGYIMQVLQTNNCKIITPSKIYDLQNESDEQFTDMKFMFSRYELKLSPSVWSEAVTNRHLRENSLALWLLMGIDLISYPVLRVAACKSN